jgi:hypothetical protein
MPRRSRARAEQSVLGREVTVDLKADADFDESRSCPRHDQFPFGLWMTLRDPFPTVGPFAFRRRSRRSSAGQREHRKRTAERAVALQARITTHCAKSSGVNNLVLVQCVALADRGVPFGSRFRS